MVDLVTYDEISHMSGGRLKADSLRMTASRGKLPKRAHPRFPVWWIEDIETWLKDQGIAPVEPLEQAPGASGGVS